MNNTITLPELSRNIAELTQCTEADAETFVRELFLLAAEKLQADDSVSIPGIGTIRISDEDIVFAPDADLADTINAPFSAFEPIELPEDYEDGESNDSEESDQSDQSDISDPEAEVEEEETEAVTEAEKENEEKEEEDETEALGSAPASSTETVKPSKRNYPICWFLACLLCFAAGWIARGFGGTASGGHTEVVIEQTIQPAIAEPEPEPIPEPKPEPIDTAKSAPSIVYDTITANRFLTTMAREHYGQMDYWVYIYQENASALGHPDRLNAGTVVIIPPAEKYGLKPGDQAKIREASALSSKIYSRFN